MPNPPAPSPSAQERPDLRALTSVRGLAAWFVVLYHVRTAAAGVLGPDLVAIFAKGYLAVDFFFMLSGFVIWLNYAERLRAGGPGSVAGFLWRRLARVYPLHLFMLAGASAFVCAHLMLGKLVPGHFALADLPLHLLLVQNWGYSGVLGWNDPAWSISAEFAAYLLFPLLAMTTDWQRWRSWSLLLMACALAVALHLAMRAGGSTTLGNDIARFGVLRCLVEFGIGTLLCACWQRWRAKPTLPFTLSVAIAATCFALFLAGAPETLAIPITFAALLLALALTAEHPRNPLAGRAIHYLGEISYATYLCHFLLFIAFKLVFVDDSGVLTLPLLTLFLGLTLAASIALYHGVERPAQRWLNRHAPAVRVRGLHGT